MSGMRKTGYQRGVGRSFTPSQQAEWVDHFNRILDEEPGWSRNRLTEHLLKEALEMRDPTCIHIPIPREGMTEEQIQLLQSEEGKRLVGNLLRFLMQSNQGEIPIPKTTPAHHSTHSLRPSEKQVEGAEESVEETEIFSPSRVERQKNEKKERDKQEPKRKKSSPLDSLKKKMSVQERYIK